ncbi:MULTISPECIES: catabolite repressor/activator [unclassified Halomonas]|uniref:catabolite repressor/activator n=1 Tax=unclassified Halomonas TaxID=2609666 RepID=UPI001C95B032|nr:MULTISPECIES: catabolite repressor/activator [unclassified Halomonas]MBY5923937.1 catabolite repressor/activator [Halomonas sp. DP4Y7-2]MBY6230979.1 catabolite repressor/activator [Halomonas sp. DP4Y7-1]
MTLAEIARLAGVSRTTASYIVNGKAKERRIRQDTVDRVMAVVREHGYRVDAQAAALRRGTSRILGLIIPDLENSSYARLAKHLERGARAAGYQLLIVGSDDQPESEKDLALALRAQRCEALIVASCLEQPEIFYADMMAEGLPVIAIDRGLSADQFASVVSDDANAAEQLTRSLMTSSVKRILWLDAVPHLSITAERRAGFHRGIEGRELECTLASGHQYAREEGARMLGEYMDANGLPDALVTASYILLEGALDELIARGGLPSRLAMASFGDNRLLDFLPLAVNSAVQDHQTIAHKALDLALEAVNGRYKPQRTVVPRHPRWRRPLPTSYRS